MDAEKLGRAGLDVDIHFDPIRVHRAPVHLRIRSDGLQTAE